MWLWITWRGFYPYRCTPFFQSRYYDSLYMTCQGTADVNSGAMHQMATFMFNIEHGPSTNEDHQLTIIQNRNTNSQNSSWWSWCYFEASVLHWACFLVKVPCGTCMHTFNHVFHRCFVFVFLRKSLINNRLPSIISQTADTVTLWVQKIPALSCGPLTRQF